MSTTILDTSYSPMTDRPRTYDEGYRDGLAAAELAEAERLATPRAPAALPREDVLEQIRRALLLASETAAAYQIRQHSQETASSLILMVESSDWIHTGAEGWLIGEYDDAGQFRSLHDRYEVLRTRPVEEEPS